LLWLRNTIAGDEFILSPHTTDIWLYRQRAFRERKEKHVKDLEAKLAGLEAAQQQSSLENERLKRDLQKISTENEILRATSHMSHGSISPEPATGPLRFKPTDFYSNVLQNHTNKSPSHRIVTSDDGERLLAAGATWDFIISHELFKKGLVDIADVSERLKNCARCDGQGPVFSERSITNAIEQSVASGTDDLL
jgi:AP-1-like transcription factor